MINAENINKDNIYSKLYQKYGEEYVVKAGYFETEDQDNCLSDAELYDSLKLLCTALPSKSQIGPNSVILLSTGCYNPLHEHHIDMMTAARNYLREIGLEAVQGYFAPDSDDYVKSKSDKYMNINQRIAHINTVLRQNPCNSWLNVEPWAGVFLNKDVNFTTIYRRLQLYVERYLGDVPIYYVCGSDRGEFSYTFEDKTIVIERTTESYDKNGFMELNIAKADVHPAAHYVKPQFTLNQSSTNIRKKWETSPALEKRPLIVRVDNRYTFAQSYHFRLFEILGESFTSQTYYYQTEQEKQFQSMRFNTISLDSLIFDQHRLELSRYYNFGGTNFLTYNNRVGSPPLMEQVAKIPKNTPLHLFDDDTFTGGTFRFAKQLLEEHMIMGETTLVRSNTDKFEVLDLRDFILGKNCGLAVQSPDLKQFRVPYMYPFVDPFIRASVLNPMEFSRALWQFNFELYEHTEQTIDAPEFECFRYIGFPKETLVTSVCKYFIKKLQ